MADKDQPHPFNPPKKRMPQRPSPDFNVDRPEDSGPTVLASMNERQRIFAQAIANGKENAIAYRMAGFTCSDKNLKNEAAKLISQPKVRAAIAFYTRQNAAAGSVTRKRVMDGFLRAVEMAEMIGDPHAVIKGWTELGKMCGYYAPEVKKININVTGKRLMSKFETMSDEDLAKLVEETMAGETELIEGEFSQDHPDPMGDLDPFYKDPAQATPASEDDDQTDE